jgi:hypothetical protein
VLEKFLPKKTREIVDLQNQAGQNGIGSHEIIIIIALAILLALLLFLWAAYIRGPKRKAEQRRSPQILPSKTPRATRSKKGEKRRWRKRNPTLSETGGLPPRKNDPFIPE